jgi:polyisoprenoid-binding protein YceI
MKKIMTVAIAILMSIASYSQTWTVDKAHAKLGFTITHMMLSEIEGRFNSFDAKFTSAKDDFSDAVIELTADASSITTDNDKRDAHLKSPDFFDVASYPTLVFKSKSFVKTEGKKYKLVGDLTMHGITKTVELDVVLNGIADAQGGSKRTAGFKITGTLNRKDFGIAPTAAGTMLSEDVNIIANAEFKENKESSAK